MTILVKIARGLFPKAPIFLAFIAIISFAIDCEAALPKKGDNIKLSGTISRISSDFAEMKLDPTIDTGDKSWPKCNEALLKIKIDSEESAAKIIKSLFEEGETLSNVPI